MLIRKPDAMGDEPARQIDSMERRGHGNQRRKREVCFKPLRRGRRRAVRRLEDQHRLRLVDHYRPGFVAAVFLVVLFSLADALLTLYLVAHGASELNPLLAACLEKGPRTFLGVKYFLTMVAVCCLAFFEKARLFRIDFSSQGLAFAFAGLFGLVIAWQAYLVWHL